MEKVIYVLWRDPRVELAEFGERLRRELAPKFVERGALGLQLNIADESVRDAAPNFQSTRPPMEALISVWLHSANEDRRRPFDDAVVPFVSRFAAYLVTESHPIVNRRYPPKPGERTEGFAQIAMFRRPPRVNREAWLDIWLGSHTQVAIDTQDTFLYVQNVVTRALTFDAPRYDAIVEEGFPPAAFGNLQAFYDAAGDEDKYRRNEAIMRESCARFIDFDKLDVVQTSQYVVMAQGGVGA
ncbi:EthD domain-containing protein [Aromatoleum anaerobium]|uniref:EthD domain-containing protein n=1 Tax=Aromatoleum anaerobium TaxID=182180 RepID=A0ABX1PNX6_9RHOO|nr:EthD domain-containing protein [Aromatoleum anaerobium]MCK0508143.1 EthD domain-containing protein [Aromatoleum anaerobium]